MIDKIRAEIANWLKNTRGQNEILDSEHLHGMVEGFKMVLDYIDESLEKEQPQGLDEAARYYEEHRGQALDSDNKECRRAFKAGAEWMAGQGETHETEIVSRINARGLLPAVTCLVDNSYKESDKVVVQIRKAK